MRFLTARHCTDCVIEGDVALRRWSEMSSADYFNGGGILQSSAIKGTILVPVYVAGVELFGTNNLKQHGDVALILVRLKGMDIS